MHYVNKLAIAPINLVISYFVRIQPIFMSVHSPKPKKKKRLCQTNTNVDHLGVLGFPYLKNHFVPSFNYNLQITWYIYDYYFSLLNFHSTLHDCIW